MNSARLKKEYPEIYKDFFNKYDIVISCPIIYFLVGDTLVLGHSSVSALSQKITLRNYIGYNLNSNDSDIEYIFKNDKGWFLNKNIENDYPLNRELFNNIGLKGDIGFLSEYNWLDIPSIGGIILIMKLLIDNSISIKDIKKLDIDNSDYKIIMDKVIDLNYILQNKYNFITKDVNDNFEIGASILKSNTQILYTRNKNKHYFKNIGKDLDFSQLDLSISIFSLDKIIKSNSYSPALHKGINELEDFISLYKIEGIKSKDIHLYKGIDYISNYYAIKGYYELYKLYKGNHYLNKFIENKLNYVNIINSLYGNTKNGINIDYIKESFIDNIIDKAFKFDIYSFSVRGPLKIISLSQKSPYISEELIEKVNKDTGMNLNMFYSSYYDGFERDGVKLEQYRSDGVMSEFSADFELEKYEEGEKNRMFGDYEELLEKSEDGLVLDMLEKKIYLDGEKFSSKQLHSQSSTLEILEILLKNIGKNISNKDLPRSSYSNSRNDMSGKIILPLVKIIEERKKVKFRFTCRGSIGEYTLKLDYSKIPVYLLKEV